MKFLACSCALVGLMALGSGCSTDANRADAPEVAADEATSTATFTVSGLTCASCGVAIRAAVGGMDGVGSVEVDDDSGTATVRYDAGRVQPHAIAATITDLGYPAILREG